MLYESIGHMKVITVRLDDNEETLDNVKVTQQSHHGLTTSAKILKYCMQNIQMSFISII